MKGAVQERGVLKLGQSAILSPKSNNKFGSGKSWSIFLSKIQETVFPSSGFVVSALDS